MNVDVGMGPRELEIKRKSVVQLSIFHPNTNPHLHLHPYHSSFTVNIESERLD